jgi:hypothetical protein
MLCAGCSCGAAAWLSRCLAPPSCRGSARGRAPPPLSTATAAGGAPAVEAAAATAGSRPSRAASAGRTATTALGRRPPSSRRWTAHASRARRRRASASQTAAVATRAPCRCDRLRAPAGDAVSLRCRWPASERSLRRCCAVPALRHQASVAVYLTNSKTCLSATSPQALGLAATDGPAIGPRRRGAA